MNVGMRDFHTQDSDAYPLARKGGFHRSCRFLGESHKPGIGLIVQVENIVVFPMLGYNQSVAGSQWAYIKKELRDRKSVV